MKLHLALALGLSIGTAAMAEPAVNPGTNWWAAFFTALDGVAPDLEHVAKQDPQYLAADEFTRAEVLARIVERLAARDPAKYRAARAEAEKAGVPLRIDRGDAA